MRIDSALADRITGLVLLALGIAMLVGGYVMDRLEIRQIHPASIPGLLPMGLGVAMIICATLLILSTRRSVAKDIGGVYSGDTAAKQTTATVPGSTGNLIVTALLCVGYAAGLVGNIPFVVATAIFIFLFSIYFLWPQSKAGAASPIRLALFCALYSIVFAAAISALFRYAFLVRLP